MSRLIVTFSDMATIPGFSPRPGFCIPLSRAWAKQHGIDFRDFVRNGVDADVLLATGDAFGIALVEWARTRRAGG